MEISSISLQGVTAGCLCISRLGYRKGVGEFVPDPEPNSSLPTPKSVVVGLLLAISQSTALGQVGSAVSLPGRILSPVEVTQGQDEANISQSISPSSYSKYCCSYQGFRRGFSLLWHQHQVKSPFLRCVVMGAIDEGKESQMWAGVLGIKVLGESRARHPENLRESTLPECREAACAFSSRLSVELLQVPSLGSWAAPASTPGTLVLEINVNNDNYS